MDKNILFIISGIDRGGLETYLLRFLRLYSSKANIKVLSLSSNVDKSLYGEYVDTNADVILWKWKKKSISSMVHFYSFLRSNDFDSVCDFRGSFSGFSLFLSYLVGIKVRISFYRESRYQFKKTYSKLFYAYIMKGFTQLFATKILSNSKESIIHFFKKKSLLNDRYRVIYNGVYDSSHISHKFIDIRKQYSIPKDAYVIGHVGRFTRAKNHTTILDIAKILCEKDDKYYFLLCGKNVDVFIDKNIDKKIQNRIITPGLCDNIPSYFKAMNLFIFPSINEGQPNALIESLLYEIPVIASDIPSIKESVPKDMLKMLCDSNDVDLFISKIEMVQNGRLYYSVADSKNWAKKMFSMHKRFEEFYQEL